MGTFGAAKQFSPGNVNGQVSILQPMSNGKVLIVDQDGRTQIMEPDITGSYENATLRRVQDCPLSSLYTCHTVANDGRVWIHGSEYFSGVDRTMIFDPVTETWTTHLTAIGSHVAVAIIDDGRAFAMSGTGRYLPANALTPASLDERPSMSYSAGEIGMALGPDGRIVVFSGGIVHVIRPDYDAAMVSAGSFDGNDTVLTVDVTSQLSSLPDTWYYGKLSMQSYLGSITYELGPSMYMPKIGQYVLVSGTGGIFAFNIATNTVTRPAFQGLEPSSTPDGILGTVHSSMNGLTPAQIQTNGTFTVQMASQGDFTTFEFLWNALGTPYRRFHAYTSGGTRQVGFTATGYSWNSGTLQLTFTGVQRANITTANTDAMVTGATVTSGRRSYSSMDSAGCIIPNGDFLFLGGWEINSINGNFNSAATLCKWNGSDAIAERIPGLLPGFSGSPFTCRMAMLPDGSALITYGTGYQRWVPDATEATPLAGSKPTITSFPNVLNPGDTVPMAGTTLNSNHEGAAYNDDSSPRTNFPVVRLTNVQTGNVYYCFSRAFTYRGIQSGRASSCLVTVPTNVPPGQYQARAIANGIPSDPVNVTVNAAVVGDVIIAGRFP